LCAFTLDADQTEFILWRKLMTTSLSHFRPVVAALLLASSGAVAANSVQTGSFNGMQWTAQNMLTGTTHTQLGGPIANGGDPIYWPSYPRDTGLVHLLMDYGGGNQFICSGSLLNDRRSILTAAHCVSDGAGTANPLSTTVFFQPPGGLPAGTRIQTGGAPNGGATAIGVSDYFVNSQYTGDVIDQNDIAVLRLAEWAPAHASGYGLYTNALSSGQDFMATGYGLLGDGATGTGNFAARLRTGDNTFDFRLGDALFNNGWSAVLGEPAAQIAHSWVSDFDNGLAANDTACLVATNGALAGAGGAVFCDFLGVGAREVGVAGGDSGGGDFIGGLLAAVNSYGLTFGTNFGDVGPPCLPLPAPSCLNSSFGEFSGYVPVYLHADWINRLLVPEPQTYALIALGLTSIFAVRRRRTARQG